MQQFLSELPTPLTDGTVFGVVNEPNLQFSERVYLTGTHQFECTAFLRYRGGEFWLLSGTIPSGGFSLAHETNTLVGGV
jgi:hypothetical protein